MNDGRYQSGKCGRDRDREIREWNAVKMTVNKASQGAFHSFVFISWWGSLNLQQQQLYCKQCDEH